MGPKWKPEFQRNISSLSAKRAILPVLWRTPSLSSQNGRLMVKGSGQPPAGPRSHRTTRQPAALIAFQTRAIPVADSMAGRPGRAHVPRIPARMLCQPRQDQQSDATYSTILGAACLLGLAAQA
jgi:hypothetical protein